MAFQLIAQADGTRIGDFTNNGGLAAGFDGNTSQPRSSSAAKGAGDRSVGYLGKDWGSGTTYTVSQVVIYGSNDFAGFSEDGADLVSFKIQGSTDNFSSSVVDLYTGSSFTPTASQVVTINTGIDTSTAYRYHRVKYSKLLSTADCLCAELQFYYTAEDIVGDAAITEAANTVAAVAALDIAGDVALTESPDTLSAAAAVDVAADLTVTEAADAIAADMEAGVFFDAGLVEAVDTSSADAIIDLSGSAAAVEVADTLSAALESALEVTASLLELADGVAAAWRVSLRYPGRTMALGGLRARAY